MTLRRKHRLKITLLIVTSLVLAVLAWPREDIALSWLGIDKDLQIKKGLDLQGGVYLVYEAQLGELQGESIDHTEVVDNAARVIERRINPGGASEATVQTAGEGRIVVQIPSVENPAQAISLIGQTAKLEFYEVKGGEGQQLLPTNISGQDVARATVDFVSQTSQPVVSLQLKGGQSTEEFAALTSRLAGSGNQLVTLLDRQVVFGPADVQQPITDGNAQLSGGFDTARAQEIADLLNAGALPVPVELVAQQSIGPTLGVDAVRASLTAAAVGLLAVIIFLIVYYRWIGLVSVAALLFYTSALITFIKLSVFTDYTIVLTLPGIAGFILSVAVAVDANILIMERVKEESADGASALRSVDQGIRHAWVSIRDANVTTIIGAAILYRFGGTPLIKGFALTLAVGIALNLLSVQTVSKLLFRQLARSRFSHKTGWLGGNLRIRKT